MAEDRQERVLTCECGFSVQGTDDELVDAAQRHGREVHNMDISREDVLAMAKPVE